MIVALTTDGQDMDRAEVCSFGRCSHLLIVDPDRMTCRALPGKDDQHEHEACASLAEALVTNEVQVLLTAHCGHGAQDRFAKDGVSGIMDCRGPVKNVLDRFREGDLQETRTQADPKSEECHGEGRSHGGRRHARRRRRGRAN